MNTIRRHLSYANVVATLALVFAMSGGALAAKHYLINSTKQINPKVLKKLAGTGKTGPAGATGAAGAVGSTGPQGKEGAQGKEGSSPKLSAVKEVLGNEVFVEHGKFGASVAKCPAGTRVISGGQLVESSETAPNIENSRALAGRTGWTVEIGNPSKFESIFVEAIAYCAGEGEAIAG
jgi:hypothetical protein